MPPPDRDANAATGGSEDPRIARSRSAILEAATACFLSRGYADTSVDEVAVRAGVVKRTVYNVFEDKETLFREVLRESLDNAERFSTQVLAGLRESDDVSDALRELGTLHARAVLGGRIVPLRRLLISETSRFPELAHDYYERAPRKVMATIAEALRRWADRGHLDVDDVDLAAEQFAFLVLGASLDEALFDPDGRPSSDEVVEARARAGVETFLRAYLPADPG